MTRRLGELTRKPRWSRVSLENLERRDLLSATPTGALLFQFTPGAGDGAASLIRAAEANQLSLTATDIPGLYRAAGDQQALARLESQFAGATGVDYVQAEGTVQVTLTPDDPAFKNGTLYGLNGTYGVKGPAAWDYTTGSLKVVVADIDTGVDYTHRDLYKNIWLNQGEINTSDFVDTDSDGLITFWDLNEQANAGKITDYNGNGYIDAGDVLRPVVNGGLADGKDNDGNGKVDDFIGWDYVNNDNDPIDDHNHGTHTVGTIAGVGNNATGVVGVAWRTQVMVLKFLGSNGSGSTTNAAASVRYAADMGAQISNNSWGGGGFSTTLFNAIAYADGKNHLFVAAAGNSGVDTDSSPHYPSSYSSYNGVTLNNVLAVAATSSSGTLAGFSNYGATSVDLAAPGVGIYSTVRGNNYESYSGTSMATPHVAGVAALLLAREPGLTDAELIARMTSTVTTVSGLSGKVATGGIVNAYAALEAGIGAYVTASTPTGTVTGNVDRVQLTFSREIKAGTFTLTDVVELTGPTGPITANGVNRLGDKVYEVTFPVQTAPGTYRLTVGPNIQNLAGVPMDQDRDLKAGEEIEDRYTATFEIQSSGGGGGGGGTVDYKFDLGTASSPVADGYTRVTESTAYSAAQGYGWTTAPAGTVDRGSSAGDGIQRDLAYGKSAAVFAVGVPNGTYKVGLVLGEQYSYDQIAIDLEGQRVGVLTTKAKEWLTPTYTVTVSDGQLTLQIQDLGGNDPWWVLNAITVTTDESGSTPAPTANAGADRSANEGSSVSFNGQATGQGLSYLWDFGDGKTASGTLSPSHTYADNGSYTVTLTVTDSQGRQASDTAVVTVANVNPTATFGNNGPVVVGNSVTASFTSVSDPSSADTDAGFKYSYDFDNDGTFEVANSSSATASHTFAATGTYTVKGRVADKDGGHTDYTTTVTVNSSPPPGSAVTKFDLGTASSPVADGYTRVTESTSYSSSQGYGWTTAPAGTVDRGSSAGDGLQRDLAYGKSAAVFVVDVPNGTYKVGLVLGEKYPYDQIAIDLEGQRAGVLTTKANQWLTPSYTVTVSDGQLTLQVQDIGGSDPWWILNAITVTEDPGSSGVNSTGSAQFGEQGQRTAGGLGAATSRSGRSQAAPAVDALFASLPQSGDRPVVAPQQGPSRGPVVDYFQALTDAGRAAFVDEVFRALQRRDERDS